MTQNLFPLQEEGFWRWIKEKHGAKGGVYKIIAADNGQRIPVSRFLGTDTNGILYIGKATSFIDRVIDLKKSISPNYNGGGHICGRRYKANPNIAKVFPYQTLHIELLQADKPEELERTLLAEYANKFGEVPPLNAM